MYQDATEGPYHTQTENAKQLSKIYKKWQVEFSQGYRRNHHLM
jgi:hypothetical protein